jgi:SAM-dependent methyltransferase
MKRLLLSIANVLGLVWRLLPESLRMGLFSGLFVLESRQLDSAAGLRRLLALRDRLDWVTNERAMAYGNGEHPKHRLMPYHAFFIEHIADGECILDVGCGYGAVARSIALARPACRVMGIDQDRPRLAQARAADNPVNLSFVEGDATQAVPSGPWDAVVLSNVLEHIVDRPNFLRALQTATAAQRYLVRVPLFEREWQMALRRELGVDFRSDADHKIEHTLAEFRDELFRAGLQAVELRTLWGEIWADCRPCLKPAPE